MALVAGIQTTLNSYHLLYNDVQKDICDILTEINSAAKQMSELSTEVAGVKQEIRNNYDSDSQEYSIKMEELNEAYNATLADIQAWESELEIKKTEKESEATQLSTYIQSYQGILTNNVSKAYTYGGGGAQ